MIGWECRYQTGFWPDPFIDETRIYEKILDCGVGAIARQAVNRYPQHG